MTNRQLHKVSKEKLMKIAQPKRRKHSCIQTWNATPDKAFPLLCPVRETDWIPDWDPKLVVSNSGVMELDCLFIEPDTPNDAIWIVTRYDPNRFVEMYRTAPAVTVSKFSITLDEAKDGTTRAFISYEHTALSNEGEKAVNNFTSEHFNELMNHFEAAINHYLSTGQKITAL